MDVLAAAAAALADNTPADPAQVPTYHGITYAQCFTCGYGTADTTTLETWNDVSGDCPACGAGKGPTTHRVLWVLTGGRVNVTTEHADGRVTTQQLRLGDANGTPPDAPGDHWPTGD